LITVLYLKDTLVVFVTRYKPLFDYLGEQDALAGRVIVDVPVGEVISVKGVNQVAYAVRSV
jgi:hypothetical protein